MPDAAPDIYADYIKGLADAETARKTSLEQRAVAVGLTANLPFLYKEAEPTADTLSAVWTYAPQEAQAFVIATRLKILSSFRHANAVKGWLVLAAGLVQLAAIVMLVLAILSIIGQNPSPVHQ